MKKEIKGERIEMKKEIKGERREGRKRWRKEKKGEESKLYDSMGNILT